MNLTKLWPTFKTRSLFVLVSFSWLLFIVTIFTITTVFNKVPNDSPQPPSEDHFHKFEVRLKEANHQIDVLMAQNRELAKNLQFFRDVKNNGLKNTNLLDSNIEPVTTNTGCDEPNTQYEQSLRRLKTNSEEIWSYLKTKLDKQTIIFTNELRYNMFYDLDLLSERDNRWRVESLKNLSDFVENRLHRLQNPKDCKTAKKLVCNVNKNCGFGCQMHHLVHCLIAAMALNRTLIVNTEGWRSSSANKNVWNKLFQPFSQTCVNSDGDNSTNWSNDKKLNTYQVIHYPIIDFIDPIPEFLPLVIPKQISEPLIRLSGEPFIWFVGQILKYIMRPNDRMKAYIKDFKQRNQFKHPIVGIHVRRTDKIGTEANFHSIDEYMAFVDDFYNKLDLKAERNSSEKRAERRVYLATDEPDVWKTEITPYKEKGYIFSGDIQLSESADPIKREGFESVYNVIIDILLLSQTDYIVCTFSSQVCRLAFELMQTQSSMQDMSIAYHSLDDIYYFGGQIFHGKQAIVSHLPQNQNELQFKAGDILGISNDLQNGYNYGDHNRTKLKGNYPRFKVIEFVESKPFASFD